MMTLMSGKVIRICYDYLSEKLIHDFVHSTFLDDLMHGRVIGI